MHLISSPTLHIIQRRILFILIISIIICFSPSKTLAYVAPYFCIMLLYFRRIIETSLVNKTIFLLLFIYLLGFYYFIIFPGFLINNYILSIITYGSFIALYLVNNKSVYNHWLFYKIITFISVVIILEGSIGIGQYLYMLLLKGWSIALGDVVEGTIHLNPESGGGFNNPIFSINMIFMTSFLVLFKNYYNNNYKKTFQINTAIIIGVVSILLGTVVHAIIFFILSIIFAMIIIYRQSIIRIILTKKIIFLFLLTSIMLTSMSNYFIPHLSLIKYYYKFATEYPEYFPKSDITIKSITIIPDENPSMVILGFGSGQFSSRASLILSGYYIGGTESKDRKQLGNQVTPAMERYLLPLMLNPKTSIRGSTSKPYYSILSIYTEMGILGILLIIFIIVKILIKIKIQGNSLVKKEKLIFLSQLIFLFLLGFQENYWEYTQAIFPGLLLMNIEFNYIKNKANFPFRY